MRLVNARILVLLAAVALAAACGSSPTSPSGAVVVKGTVLDASVGVGQVTAQSAGAPVASSGGGRITVTAQGTTTTATVSGNGTFGLDGLAAGTFTLVFTRDGVTIGTVTVTGTGGGDEVEIVVKVEATNVTLVQLQINGHDADASKTCMINGG